MKSLSVDALHLAEKFFEGIDSASKLDLFTCNQYDKNAVYGWNIELDCGHNLIVCIKKSFPFDGLPKTYLKKAAELPPYLHIENDGGLCLDLDADSINVDRPQDILTDVLKSATHLIENLVEIDSKVCKLGYQDEFLSYWVRQINSTKSFYVITPPKKSVQILHALSCDGFTVIAETSKECVDWANNFLGKTTRLIQESDCRSAIFVWLDELPVPSSYPKIGLDIYRSAKENNYVDELERVIEKNKDMVISIFGYEDKSEPFFFGGFVQKKKLKKVKGFRPGTEPGEIVRKISYEQRKLFVPHITRVDASWIHARGGPLKRNPVKHVTIIGCGSLGAPVAIQLAQSGMNLTLIDNDVLQFENIARHPLGGHKYINKNKAEALSLYLKEHFPHLQITPLNKTAQELAIDSPDVFFESDLVVSTCASWSAELPLSLLTRMNAKMPTVIFGWAEPHAVAGQVLIVADMGGCFNCEMENPVNAAHRVSDWKASEEIQEAACGAFYQPYGAIDIAPIYTLISRAALEVLHGNVVYSELRTWIGDTVLLEDLGGSISKYWSDKEIGAGNREFRERHKINDNCKICKA